MNHSVDRHACVKQITTQDCPERCAATHDHVRKHPQSALEPTWRLGDHAGIDAYSGGNSETAARIESTEVYCDLLTGQERRHGAAD